MHYKLRSVRISQGDMVYGIYGGDGPRMILVFFLEQKDNYYLVKFKTLSGFYGSLKNTGILDGEFNEQLGPKTPKCSGLSPKKWTKATARESIRKSKQDRCNCKARKEFDEETEINLQKKY